MTAEPVPPQPTTAIRRSPRTLWISVTEGTDVPFELVREWYCLLEPVPKEREPPPGYPQAINISAAVVGFDVAGEAKIAVWSSEN